MLRSLKTQEGSQAAPGPFVRRDNSLCQEPSLEVLDIHTVAKVDRTHSWAICKILYHPKPLEDQRFPARFNTFHFVTEMWQSPKLGPSSAELERHSG